MSQELIQEFADRFEKAILATKDELTKEHPSLKSNELVRGLHMALDKTLAATYATEAVPTQHQKELVPTRARKSSKPVRAYIDGCFDIMHSGHYNAIRQAKALTDILVVGVHSCAEILKHKGPPVMTDDERMAMVKACKWVDEVVFDTPYDPSIELLDKHNCDFCVHGDDTSTTSDGNDAYKEVRDAGRLRIIKRTEGVSTTDLVGRLLLMTKNHHISPGLGPVSPKLAAIAHPPPAKKEGGRTERGFSLSSDFKALTPEKGAMPDFPPLEPSAVKIATPQKKQEQHYNAGVSKFLPTTFRISQFCNGRVPKQGDTVVYVDGAFDLFHVGHVETLEKAKKLGDFLYVGIHDDDTVNKHKGRNYPIMNLHERVMNVLSCKCVDEVVIGAPWEITKDLITSLGINIVTSGVCTKLDKDFEPSASDPYTLVKKEGIFKQIDSSRHLNTEDVIDRIISNRLKFENRNKSRSKKELDYTSKKAYVQEI